MAQTLPFLRVDDRLIHGQIVVAWVKALGSKAIWVVSDRAAASYFETILLKNVAPPQVAVEVLRVQDAVPMWHRRPVPDLLILTENLQTVLELYNGGIPLGEINVGGMRYRSGTTPLNRAVYVSPSDVALLQQMEARELTVYLRIIPTDRKIDAFERVRRRLGR